MMSTRKESLRVLFAAPETAWHGILARLANELPDCEFESTGNFEIPSLKGVDVLIPTMSRVDAGVIATSDQLKLIQQVGVGLEGVDIAAARSGGIQVANVPSADSGNADSVAELGLYLMLGLARNFRQLPRNLQNRAIGAPLGTTLQGKVAGVIGLGGLGKALVSRLQALGMEVRGIKQSNPQQAASELGLSWAGTLEDIDTLLGSSDYVILTLPDTPDTHDLMNSRTFSMMKATGFLINLGRGGLVNREALLQALESGKIAGAGLDVFWSEPPDPDDEIFQHNVMATPHVGGVTDLCQDGVIAAVTENLTRLSEGRELLHTQ